MFEKIFVSVMSALVLVHSPGLAQSSSITVRGFLVDRQCADSVRHDADPVAFIKHHTKDCALMPNCRARGYCLYAGGKWLNLDARGNKLAIELIQKSKRKRGFFVEMTGRKEERQFVVQAMTEVAEESAARAGEESR